LTSQVTTSTGGTPSICYITEGMNRFNLLPSEWIHVQGQPDLPNSEKDKLRIDDNEHFITSDVRYILFNLTRDGIEPIFIEMLNITDYMNSIFSIQILYQEANDTSYSVITQDERMKVNGNAFVVYLNKYVRNLLLYPISLDVNIPIEIDVSIRGCFQ
ncbi:hypothetical protein ACJMK2_024173, partial [Sinanodonta woodiana]